MKSGLRKNRRLNSCLMSEIQSDTLTLKEAFEKADTLGRTALLLAFLVFYRTHAEGAGNLRDSGCYTPGHCG